MKGKTSMPDGFEEYVDEHYFRLHESVRMLAKHFGVHHKTISQWMHRIRKPPLSKEESAKYTWRNHKHPNLGKKGKESHQYGKKMSEATKAKLRAANLGPNNYHWSGGRKKHTFGYVLVYAPNHPKRDANGFVLEHRRVMEKHLGRILSEEELVHHINGIKTDNRIENLRLTNRAEHARLHHRLRTRKIEVSGIE